MSKEKQIEGMIDFFKSLLPTKGVASGIPIKVNHNYEAYAKALYNADYRKQSEGKWKKRGNEKTCSLCKFIYYSNNDEWSYCPNCGAKMKGGAE